MPRRLNHHQYLITVHDTPLASMGGAHSYGVKCNLSLEAMKILREEGGMARYCNCDKANLPLDQSASGKRKGCSDPDDVPKNKKRVEGSEEDTIMFDYNTYIDQQELDIDTNAHDQRPPADDDADDQEVEDLLPGMNPVGYTTYAGQDTIDPPDDIPSEVKSGKQVVKKESFYVQAEDDNIIIDDSDDEEIVVQGQYVTGTTQVNTGNPRGFEEGEIIVIDDD